MSLTIRPAIKSDVPQILEFIRDLAEFEKSPKLCVATLEDLESTLGFTDRPQYAYAVIASREIGTGTAVRVESVGMAIYFTNYSTWHAQPGIWLEDLYVKPEARGQGYGTSLIRYLAKEVKKMGGRRLEWCVLKWNQKAIDVYEGKTVGAEMMKEWVTMRVDGDRLDQLATAADT